MSEDTKDFQDINKAVSKEDVAKAYGKYSEQFTPKPNYLANCLKAFLVGGGVCTAAYFAAGRLAAAGLSQRNAETYVTIGLVMIAQLLTGIGIFDKIFSYFVYRPKFFSISSNFFNVLLKTSLTACRVVLFCSAISARLAL